MSEPRCPSCGSSTLSVERRPDGDARCAMCGWSGKYAACFGETYKVAIQNPEARIKELESQLKEANEVVAFYADRDNWTKGTTQKCSAMIGPDDHDAESYTAPYFAGSKARAYLKKWEVEK